MTFGFDSVTHWSTSAGASGSLHITACLSTGEVAFLIVGHRPSKLKQERFGVS